MIRQIYPVLKVRQGLLLVWNISKVRMPNRTLFLLHQTSQTSACLIIIRVLARYRRVLFFVGKTNLSKCKLRDIFFQLVGPVKVDHLQTKPKWSISFDFQQKFLEFWPEYYWSAKVCHSYFLKIKLLSFQTRKLVQIASWLCNNTNHLILPWMSYVKQQN